MQESLTKAVIYTSSQRSVYFGKLAAVTHRACPGAVLTVSLDHQVEIIAGDRRYKTHCFLTPPGTEVTFHTHGATLAVVFLDSLGTDFPKAVTLMEHHLRFDADNSLYLHSQHYQQLKLYAKAIYCAQAPDSFIEGLFHNWDNYQPVSLPIEPFDERVEQVISIIQEDYARNTPVKELAKKVNLSVPRLAQLFKKNTGSPIRQFRLWHRIFVAARKVTEGYSLTEAALHAGFSDYAQFSRVYKKLVGSSPSSAKRYTDIRVLKP
jgi:AraC-like DNA-binding protein